MVLSFLYSCGLIVGWCCCHYSCHFSVSQPILHLSLSYKLFCASLCAYLDRIYWTVCLANPLLATIHPPSASYTGGWSCLYVYHHPLATAHWFGSKYMIQTGSSSSFPGISIWERENFLFQNGWTSNTHSKLPGKLFPSRCLGRRESLCTDTHSKEQRWETKMESCEHMSWEGASNLQLLWVPIIPWFLPLLRLKFHDTPGPFQ